MPSKVPISKSVYAKPNAIAIENHINIIMNKHKLYFQIKIRPMAKTVQSKFKMRKNVFIQKTYVEVG